MPKLPRVTGKQLLKFLEGEGFEVVRIRGSHFFLRNEVLNLRTTVPIHSKEILRPGTMLGILSDIEMGKTEFCEKYAR